MTIYGEYLFLENFAAGLIALLVTGRLCRRFPQVPRLLAGSAMCGGAAFLIFVPVQTVAAAVASLFLKTGFCLVTVLVVFGVRRLIRNSAVFLCVNLGMGGVTVALLYLLGGTGIADHGFFYVPATYPVIAAGLFASMVIGYGAAVRFRHMRTEKQVTVCFQGRRQVFEAFIDTGNHLKDPLSGLPVAVITEAAAEQLLYRGHSGGKARIPPECFCVIPYRSVGKTGVMSGFAAEAVIDGCRRKLVLAIYEGTFQSYDMLLGDLEMREENEKVGTGLTLFRRMMEKLKKVNVFGDGADDALFYIGGSDVLPPPLSPEEERELIAAFEQGDEQARGLLIERNLRLVVYIARKFENAGINVEDLISIGAIGLIKAVNTFDSHKNIKLATYASRCIENEILMFLRRSYRTRSEVSFDEPLNVDWDGNELLLSDILGTESDVVYGCIEEEVNRKLLDSALEKLSARERQIMEMRFGLRSGQEMTQKEVADRMGISQSYISRLEKKIIGRLKREMKKLG